MKRDEARRLVAALVAAFPRAEIGDETVSLYVRRLEPLGFEETTVAVERLIDTSVFFPAVAEIKREVGLGRVAAMGAAAAWEHVAGGYGRGGLDVAGRRALEAVGGGWAVRTSENMTALRAQFMGLYREFVNEAVEEEITVSRRRELPAPDVSEEGEAGVGELSR